MTRCNFGIFCLAHIPAYEHCGAIFILTTTHITRSLFILVVSLCRGSVRIKIGIRLKYFSHYPWQEPDGLSDGPVTFEFSACWKIIMENEDRILEEVDIVFRVEKVVGREIKTNNKTPKNQGHT